MLGGGGQATKGPGSRSVALPGAPGAREGGSQAWRGGGVQRAVFPWRTLVSGLVGHFVQTWPDSECSHTVQFLDSAVLGPWNRDIFSSGLCDIIIII